MEVKKSPKADLEGQKEYLAAYRLCVYPCSHVCSFRMD